MCTFTDENRAAHATFPLNLTGEYSQSSTILIQKKTENFNGWEPKHVNLEDSLKSYKES